MIVAVTNLQKLIPISIPFITNLATRIGVLTDTDDYDVCVWLVDNKYTHNLNKSDRGKDKPADVLSVPLHPNNPPGQRPPELGYELDLGDIYVSLEMLHQQATERNICFEEHIKKVIIHGYCHLLGYDHEKDDDFALMVAEEDRLYNSLGELSKE